MPSLSSLVEKVLQFKKLLIAKLRNVNIDLDVHVSLLLLRVPYWHSLLFNHFNKARLGYSLLLYDYFTTVELLYHFSIA